MGTFYVLFYRMYFILKKSAEGVLRRSPGTGRGLDPLEWLVQCHFVRKAHAWVRIQSGLSQGLWMQIYLPGEAGLWRGEHEPDVQNAILAAGSAGCSCL